jgi:hypothetical protein
MKLSNRANLPDAIVRAVANDPYSRGDAEFSITQLLKPPRQAALQERHSDEIESDAEDLLWALYGQLAHSLLERAGGENAITEKRYFGEIDGVRISGQIDTLCLESGTLSDWKFTTAYKFKAGQPAPEEWVAQLNMQLELLRQNGQDASALQIVGLLRDFSKLEAKRTEDYPQRSVIVMPIPLWPREKTQAFMKSRVNLHRMARITLPECSPEERWEKPTKWALKKRGAARATRLYDTEAEARAHASTDPKNLIVEKRPGEATRCQFYCSAAPFCEQANEASSDEAKESEAVTA